MNRSAIAFLLFALGAAGLGAAEHPRPNILWVVCEDINPQLGCYGDPQAVTPNIDKLAARSLRYAHCWSNAPVCAPARTTLITGVYPPSTGGEHMRSMVAMPGFMRMYPQLLRAQGYYCANNRKEDYNLVKPADVWDESSRKAHYKNRKPGQPFFAVFNIETSHESQIRKQPHALEHDPAKMRVPAYHPDAPEVRRDWAQYYDQITAMDRIAGQHFQELVDAGLADDTIVFFYGDNGGGMPRSKRWPYNSGLNVPLLAHFPAKFKHLAPADYRPGAASDRLVAFVDFAPTLLSLLSVKPPAWMQGQAFLGPFAAAPAKYQHGFRGRMDERYDLVRSVSNGRYIYIRNYMPHLIYGQHIDYMFQTPTTRVWKALYDAGKLAPPKTFFWEPKPAEELYDLRSDPDEVQNLVGSPTHQTVLGELRAAQRAHALAVRDVGFLSESERLRRAGGASLYEFGHDAKKYPLESILAMAELAAARTPEALPQLRAGLAHADSGVRYWAALGLLIRGQAAVESARDGLVNRLDDQSPSVRIVAARALGQYGAAADLPLVLPALAALAPPDKNGVFVSLEALGAIEALGAKAESLRPLLAAMPRKDPQAADRMASYVGRFVQYLLQEKDVSQPKTKQN